MESLKKYPSRFAGKKILVLGDLMLDEHIWSTVSRISPEAPVPIADVSRITHVPGGCGNVAANLASLGAIPYLVGMIGEDSSGDKLLRALKKNRIGDEFIVRNENRPTILKSRILAGSQHVVRVDREDRTAVSPALTRKILQTFKKLLPRVDAAIISDYGKGLVTKEIAQALIALAKKYKKPVAVDPKGVDYAKYRGATVITPNLREASIAARTVIIDEKGLNRAGRALQQITAAKYILITRGKDGMSLFGADKGEAIYLPAVPREVFDITGAGDTVIATLMVALACGAGIKEAATLSNYAASVVIGKIGTAVCSRQELEEVLEGKEPITRKIKLRSEVAAIAQNLRNEGAKIVFTNGCFDLLHLGHVRYLREAKKLGDVLMVGLNSDDSVRALKGPERPYISELERAEILASLECVDLVTIFPELRPDNLIKLVRPDFHVKGGDYRVRDLPERKLVESLGGKVMVISPIKGKSTTGIVERILAKRNG